MSEFLEKPVAPVKGFRTLTVVFRIKDYEKFEEENPNLKALLLASHDAEASYCVTAMSVGNEVQRAEIIDQILNSKKFDDFDKLALIEDALELFEPEEFTNFTKENLDGCYE